MDHTVQILGAAHELYSRDDATTETRPPVYKAIGISLAIASGVFIGISFVLKKIGLLKANEKYSEVAGEGYGYLKNAFWWTGMTLMIIGEICNFVAYAFVDAILVTPLGALSVVITTILSAIFLKERLSLVGKVGCFLCIVGSVVIVMNAPSESSAANIQEMQGFVIAPGFLSYAGVVILGCAFIAFWAGPRYGKKSMLVYLSICSLIGGLSVVATQGLGAAIVAQVGGTPQFNQWFLYVLLVFVIATLVTEIIYLNKALNLFNAALVTPTYYVFFTSSTIVTSAILFRGFKGTVTSIITVVMGFFVICAGVVLLQLSKSAKDVPDAAVFAGDVDQIRTIAEQEQPESEPKADAIRGAAAIVRRFSQTRQRMEMDEARRIHEEKLKDLEPIGENEQIEWDGLRRRRTVIGGPARAPSTPRQTPIHPPLGMSHFPTEEELQEEENRPNTGGLGSSFLGSIRTRAKSMIAPGQSRHGHDGSMQSPMHPVPLTEIAIPSYHGNDRAGYYDQNDHVYGLPRGLQSQKTEYEGAGAGGGSQQHIHFDEVERSGSRNSSLAPAPPPHSARRQFSFHNVFRKAQTPGSEDALPSSSHGIGRLGLGSRSGSQGNSRATEEERLGLVKGDTNIAKFPEYDDDDGTEDEWPIEDKGKQSPLIASTGRVVTVNAPRVKDPELEKDAHEQPKPKWNDRRGSPPPPFDESQGGAFI